MAWDAATLRGIIDNISKNVKLLITTLGTTTTADTVLYHITQNQTRIDGIGDADYEKYLELANDKANTEAAALPYIVYAGLARTLADTIQTNAEQSLSDEWRDKAEGQDATNARMPCYFRDLIKGNIDTDLVFPKENIILGSYDIATPEYTDGEEIDTTKYGGAYLKYVVTTQIDAANNAVVTLNGVDENGSKLTLEVTIPMGSIVGYSEEIDPEEDENTMADLQSITVTGATTGAFDIKSREDRALTA